MREIAKTTICALLGLAFVAGVYWYVQDRFHSVAPRVGGHPYESGVGWISRTDAEKELGKRILLESPTGLQVWINECPDVNIKVDGKLGPETAEGYGTAYMYQMGIYECQKAGM